MKKMLSGIEIYKFFVSDNLKTSKSYQYLSNLDAKQTSPVYNFKGEIISLFDNNKLKHIHLINILVIYMQNRQA